MRAITLTQPWATLVMVGAKTIETRDWQTTYLGEIAIHAAKGFPDDACYLTQQEPFSIALSNMRPSELPKGCILGLVDIVQCFQFGAGTEAQIRERSKAGGLPPFEADFGNYDAGRFGFRLANIRILHRPVPARGMLSLWSVPSDIEREVLAQLAA